MIRDWRRNAGRGLSTQERLERMSCPEPNSGCLLWLGTESKEGYGQIRHNGRMRYAHRVAWELHHGPIPEGMEVDHKCRVRPCINTDHLRLLSHRDNVLEPRAETVPRKNLSKTHCIRGHELVGANLHPWHLARGRRYCRVCQAQLQRERYARGAA